MVISSRTWPAALQARSGIGASANLGFDPAAVVRVALFDAAHGTAPDIAGKNVANPTAIFLALSLLLYQLGEIAIGQAVKNATLDLLRQGVRTGDLGGSRQPRASPRPSPPGVATAGTAATPTAVETTPASLVQDSLSSRRLALEPAERFAPTTMRPGSKISIAALMRLIALCALETGDVQAIAFSHPDTAGHHGGRVAESGRSVRIPAAAAALAARIGGLLSGGLISIFVLVGYYLTADPQKPDCGRRRRKGTGDRSFPTWPPPGPTRPERWPGCSDSGHGRPRWSKSSCWTRSAWRSSGPAAGSISHGPRNRRSKRARPALDDPALLTTRQGLHDGFPIPDVHRRDHAARRRGSRSRLVMFQDVLEIVLFPPITMIFLVASTWGCFTCWPGRGPGERESSGMIWGGVAAFLAVIVAYQVLGNLGGPHYVPA